MKALLLVLLIGCGQVEICEAPCPRASGQQAGPAGTLCWCGSTVMFFPWVELGEACDAQREASMAAIPDGGCPIIPGGHAP